MSKLVLTLAPDHRATRGHFPGNPIIPGAVLLSETLSAISSAEHRDFALWAVSFAKFPAPARPGDRVGIEYTVDGTRLILACSVEKRTVLKVELMCTKNGE